MNKEKTKEKLLETDRKPNSSNDGDMIDWWMGTVIFTFFPTLSAILIDVCRHETVDFAKMIGDGELILSSFLMITPSIINFYKSDIKKRNRWNKILVYGLLLMAFLQLIMYTSIKTNTDNDFGIVLITSTLSVIGSIIIAWMSERVMKGGNDK